MNKTLKWILIVAGVGLLLYISFAIFLFSLFGIDDEKYYSKEDLINNYNQKRREISDLKLYINTVVSADKEVDIEFDDKGHFFNFHVTADGNYETNWDVKLNSPKIDTLLKKLNWTRQTLKILKEKLDAANCISVRNGEPCNIGFQRSGMGKYYYNIFDKPVPEHMKDKYNDSCTYILHTNTVVLEYGGGAIGPQCFSKAN